jgi:hypothetical protein
MIGLVIVLFAANTVCEHDVTPDQSIQGEAAINNTVQLYKHCI